MKKSVIALLVLIAAFGLFAEKMVKIYPLDKKQSSGIYVKKGDIIKIEASGTWTLWSKYKAAGPEGHQYIANEFGNWGLLLGKIGATKPFTVGTALEFTSENEGVLYLFPNKGEYKIEDQSGNLDIKITGGTELDALKTDLLTKGVKVNYNPKNGFLATDLYVNKDTELEIFAFGEWTMWENNLPFTTAEGHDYTVSGIPWGKLYGGIGSTYGQYLEYFPIGEKNKYTASKSGILSLFAYIDNYQSSENGTLDVYITGAKPASEEDKKNSDESVRKNSEITALNTINEIRASCALTKLEINPVISQAAFNHAKYMILNNSFTREEEQDKINFTGKTLTERLEKSGFKGNSYEILCESDSTLNAVSLTLNTVYHRLRLLNPEFKYFGYGNYKSKNKTYHVFDFGYDAVENSKLTWETIVYPPNNATEVNLSWTGEELPDPLPIGANKPVGSPVSILFSKKLTKIIKAEIIDESGKSVNSYIITPETDLNNKQINGIILIPKMPFIKNVKYTINIKVMFDKEEKEYQWSFITKDVINALK